MRDSPRIEPLKTKLQPEAQKMFRHLERELAGVAVTWGQWKVLFAPPNAYGPSLEAAAPAFFVIVRESMMNDLLAAFMRLLDPPQSMGKDNCSFEKLLKQLPSGKWRRRCFAALKRLRNETKILKKWRNRRLAHNDYLTTIRRRKLPSIPLAKIEQALRSASDLLNLVNAELGRLSGLYHDVYTPGGASCLMTFLDTGLDAIHGKNKRPPLAQRKPVKSS